MATEPDSPDETSRGGAISTATYIVTGMTCEHCEMSVREEISEIAAVTGIEVDLPTGTVVVTSTEPVPDERIATAVQEAGYALAGPTGGTS